MSRPIVLESRELSDWIHLRAGKANALGPVLADAWEECLPLLESYDPDGPARPVVLTGEGSAFSAGLDLPSLIAFSRDELERFCERLSRVFLSLATSPRPVIAAINGHAVAGGLVLALACDHRVAVTHIAGSGKPCRLGLKETVLGLTLPTVAAALVESVLDRRGALLEVALTGDLFATERALELGIIDRAVRAETFTSEIRRTTERFSQGTGAAVAEVKRRYSQSFVRWLEERPDDRTFLDAWFSPSTRERLRETVAALSK